MCCECCLNPGFLRKWNLPISAGQIQGGEPLLTGHIQRIVDPGQWVGILDSRNDGSPHRTGYPHLFSSPCRPWAVTWFNLSTGQHVGDTFLLLFDCLRWHPAECTYRWTVTRIYIMFLCIWNKSEYWSDTLANWRCCVPSKSRDVWSSKSCRCVGSGLLLYELRHWGFVIDCMADICATMPTSENGLTITVSWLKLDTRTRTFHLEGSTRVLPTPRPVFSVNNVSHSNNPLEDMGRPLFAWCNEALPLSPRRSDVQIAYSNRQVCTEETCLVSGNEPEYVRIVSNWSTWS